MTLNKLNLGIFVAVIATWGITSLVVHRQSQTQLQEQNHAFQEQLGQLNSINQRLSVLLAQATQIPPVSNEQLSELKRLQEEVGFLKMRTNELHQMLAKYAQLAVTVARPGIETNQISINPIIFTAIPKESWGFSGYTTPEAALQSALWAMSNGDIQAFQNSITPESQKAFDSQFKGKPDAFIKAELKNSTSELDGLYLDQKRVTENGKVTFTLAPTDQLDDPDFPANEITMTLKQIGNEWKLMLSANE